jgi:hypothetical protein
LPTSFAGSPVRENLPAELLLWLLHATPEQVDAIYRFAREQCSANQAEQLSEPDSTRAEPEPLPFAAKVMELLKALDPDERLRKAPPIKVFLLRFRNGLSRPEIAYECKCGRTLVGKRLRMILKKLPWDPQQLREVSAYVEAMQESLSDPRARRIYRRGAVYGDEVD